MRRSKYESTKAWRTEDDILIKEGVLEAFVIVWRREKTDMRRILKRKRLEKIAWLKSKFRVQEEVPDEYEGYKVGDQELGAEFEGGGVAYGGVQVTNDEREALKLHPKYTVYEKVDVREFMAEVEKALAKVRWDRGFKKTGAQEEEERPEWYDLENNTIDLRNMSSTDLPFNSRVFLPDALKDTEEVELQMVKMKLKATAEEYKKSQESNGKEKEYKNLTKEEVRGVKSLKQKREEKEIVIFQTDKSSKLAIDSTENYINSMRVHVEGDTTIDAKELRDIEGKINAHATCWIRFMNAGKHTGDTWRVKMSMLSHNSNPAVVYGLRKDHKTVATAEQNDEDNEIDFNVHNGEGGGGGGIGEGPPLRPVCDVTGGA